MAARKPLVLNSGEIQQLQSGDTLSAPISEVAVITLTNGDAGNHVLGNVVYISAADTAKTAKADASGTTNALAFATATITNGTTGAYQTDGILSGLTGLTAGAVYYLSDSTTGAMTSTAPSTLGHYVVRLGTALSTTELEIRIERAILLGSIGKDGQILVNSVTGDKWYKRNGAWIIYGDNAYQFQGVPVDPTPPSNGQALVYNAGTLKYAPASVVSSGGWTQLINENGSSLTNWTIKSGTWATTGTEFTETGAFGSDPLG
jgi:hypothetical protein